MQSETNYHLYNNDNSVNYYRSTGRYFLHQWCKYITPVVGMCGYYLMPIPLIFLIRTPKEEKVFAYVQMKNP